MVTIDLNLTPVEILAAIFLLVAVVKIIMISYKPKSWANIVKAAYEKKVVTMLISLVLAAIVLNYLIAELTIIQIVAAMFFTTLLIIIGTTAYGKDFISMESKVLNNKELLKKIWLYLLIWLVLIAWAIYELYLKLVPVP